MSLKTRFLIFLTLLVTLLASAACAGAPLQPPQPTATQAAAEMLSTATLRPPEPTLAPTDAPQPKKAVLVAPSGSDPQLLQEVQQALAELAAPAQMVTETRESLQPGDLTAELAVVIWLAAPANLNELVAAAPQTAFVVFSAADLPVGGNLSVVRLQPEFQAFVGGFIVALLSPNWRAAGLLPGDGPLGEGLVNAFVNGGRYFCGVCAPGWPLGVKYPQTGVLPAAADGVGWQTAAAGLFDVQKVDAYYLAAEAAKGEVFAYLQGKDQFGVPVRVAGAIQPPVELQNQWAATVRFDLAAGLRQVWPDAAAGKGGLTVFAPIAVVNVNPNHLGDGKMRLVRELLAEIAAGRVYPFTVPAE